VLDPYGPTSHIGDVHVGLDGHIARLSVEVDVMERLDLYPWAISEQDLPGDARQENSETTSEDADPHSRVSLRRPSCARIARRILSLLSLDGDSTCPRFELRGAPPTQPAKTHLG